MQVIIASSQWCVYICVCVLGGGMAEGGGGFGLGLSNMGVGCHQYFRFSLPPDHTLSYFN